MEKTVYETYKEMTNFLDKFDECYKYYVEEIEPKVLKLKDEKKFDKTENAFQKFKALKSELNDMCCDITNSKYDEVMEGKWQTVINC